MSLLYLWEKSFKAVHDAATHTGSPQKRLEGAYAYNLAHLDKARDDIPEPIWSRLERIHTALNFIPPKGDEGTIASTTASMTNDEASQWLGELVGLFDKVAEAYYIATPEQRMGG